MTNTSKVLIGVAVVAVAAGVAFVAYKKYGQKKPRNAPHPNNNSSSNGIGGTGGSNNNNDDGGTDWGDTATGALESIGDWAGWN